MSHFNNVNVKKEANIYFDGKVTSRTVEFNDGTRKTLGIMLPASTRLVRQKKRLWIYFRESLN